MISSINSLNVSFKSQDVQNKSQKPFSAIPEENPKLEQDKADVIEALRAEIEKMEKMCLEIENTSPNDNLVDIKKYLASLKNHLAELENTV